MRGPIQNKAKTFIFALGARVSIGSYSLTRFLWVANRKGLEMEKLLDSKEAAQFLAVNTKTLQRLARSGDVRGIKIGKLWRFSKEDLVVGPDSKKKT